MRTVGEVLKSKRLENKLTLNEVEMATKIRVRYLEAVEKNDFTSIPGGAPITKGFIKNYAEFLKLPPNELLAIFRRDFTESKTGQIIPHGYYEPLNQGKFAWNPKLTFILIAVVLLLSLSGYIFYQISTYMGEPRLSLITPKGDLALSEAEIEVNGESDPDAAVYVNGDLVSVDRQGQFKTKVGLLPGENKIKVESVSRNGKTTEIVRRVERQSF